MKPHRDNMNTPDPERSTNDQDPHPLEKPGEAGTIPSRRQEPIDGAVLEGLHRLHRDGRPDLAKIVIMLFLDSAPAVLSDLERGAARDDPDLLRQASHILLSSAAAVGAVVLSARCKELEAFARSGSIPDATTRVQVIGRLYAEAEGALRAWCSGRN
jgi:HPt (histidine-containing phosphotransfer) domain-containing protein